MNEAAIKALGVKKGTLDLTAIDGNAFAILAGVRRALRRAGNTDEVIDAVLEEMRAGDYQHLVTTAASVVVDPEDLLLTTRPRDRRAHGGQPLTQPTIQRPIQ
jgi:hypothetical protein